MKYLLGVDFGGGSSKATLLDERGNIAAESTVEYPTLHPRNGYCEQDPRDWMRALVGNVDAILKKAGIDAGSIAGVAVDSATHTAVLCDGEGNPLRPAIHWTDSRSADQAVRLNGQYGDRIFELTFHRPDTIWTLPQLLWIRENEPEIADRTKMIFFEKDYIRYRLTGVHCTDRIEAQGSMLFDCRQGVWSPELCALSGFSPAILPPVCAPTDIIGTVSGEAAELTGLAAGTPVVCGTTDTVAEIFAAGAVLRGDTTVKLATAGRICVITDHACPDRNLVNYSHIVQGLWYPGTATKAAASSLRWYRDTFGGDYRTMDAQAATVPIGCEGLIFHPYINGELTPYADPALCGSFIGIRATHTRAHFNRSVLEGVSLSLLHSLVTLRSLGIEPAARATLIGGGAKSRLWQQITADCLGMTLDLTQNSDSSLGSAMLCGIAVGIFDSPETAVRLCVKKTGSVSPDAESTAAYARLFETYVRIHDALAPVYRGR